MFQLDDTFLNDAGLGDLPEEQRKPFLQYIYDQLEYRVGMYLSEGLSDDQLEEFSDIADANEQVVMSWLSRFDPNYQQNELFIKLKSSQPANINNSVLLSEYASTRWLEINRPDYRTVVANTLAQLKQEIAQNRDALLSE